MSGDDGQVIDVVYLIKGEEQVRATMQTPDSSEPFFEGWTNGRKAWRNGEPCQECMAGERTFDALNPVFKLIMADQLLKPSNPDVATLYAGRVENDGQTFDQIEVRSPELGKMQAYFDEETGLLRWIEGAKIGVVRYDDYRAMPGGKLLPYRIEGDYDGTYLVIVVRARSGLIMLPGPPNPYMASVVKILLANSAGMVGRSSSQSKKGGLPGLCSG